MDEDILESILDEIDHDRGRQSRSLLVDLEEELEPIQFLNLKGIDLETVTDLEDEPGEDSIPFAILSDDRSELDIGLWSINLN